MQPWRITALLESESSLVVLPSQSIQMLEYSAFNKKFKIASIKHMLLFLPYRNQLWNICTLL